VGTADTFHLDEPARLLEQTIKDLGGKASFTYVEGRSHFDLYQGGLSERIAKEMYAVARPTNRSAQGRHESPVSPKRRATSNFEVVSNVDAETRRRVASGDLFLESLLFTIQHHLVESVGQRLAAGVGAGFVGAGFDSCLRQL